MRTLWQKQTLIPALTHNQISNLEANIGPCGFLGDGYGDESVQFYKGVFWGGKVITLGYLLSF